MQNLANLFNQALTTVGHAADVTDPTAKSRSTDLLNLWYSVARRAVFTAAYWPSLRKTARLSLAATRDTGEAWVGTNPPPGYINAYAYPSDMLQPQFMEDYSPFKLGRLGASRVINTNTPNPILNYTVDEENLTLWEPDLYRAVIWSLAGCINMAKNGKMQLTEKLERQTLALISQANVIAANAEDEYFDSIPSFWVGTGFEVPHNAPRYFYPVSTYNLSGLF